MFGYCVWKQRQEDRMWKQFKKDFAVTKQKQMSQNLKQKTDRSVSDKWCHSLWWMMKNEKCRKQPYPHYPLTPSVNMQKTAHLDWPKPAFLEKDTGKCLCYDNSDEGQPERTEKGSSKGAKWNNVDCDTAGMNDNTKDLMGCPAGLSKSRNESDRNKW